jgi:hypothetical protein
LEKEEYVVVVIPKCDVIASTEEEVCCDTKLQNMQPDSTLMLSHENEKMNQNGQILVTYLSPILMQGLLDPLPGIFILKASPSFSVTTHSFTLPASNRPMKVAFVLCKDITFSKSTQKTIK